jgi:capsular exopolysaccharide synthesis family protein
MDNGINENASAIPNISTSEDLPYRSLLHIALRCRWTILLTIIASLAVAFVYLLKATPIYTSLARLYVEQSEPRIINEYEGVMARSGNYLYTQAELIKSTPIVGDAVENGNIKSFRTFDEVDNLVAFLKKDLTVTVGARNDIITVAFDSPYPDEAAQIVNTVVDAYIRFHTVSKRSTVAEVLRILQREKVKRDKELSDKFTEMLEFTRKNGVVSFDAKNGNIVFERLTKLSGALTEAQLAVLNAKADYEAVKSMADEPAKIKQFAHASSYAGVSIFISDRETQLETELREAEIELKNALYHCTDDHPSVRAIHDKIDRIKRELNEQATEFADAYIEVMQLRWLAAKEREDELQASLDSQQQIAQGLGVKAAEYSVLQSEVNRAERICEILDNRIKELNVTEDAGALSISILEVARPADVPSQPRKTRVVSMALILGLILGCILALLREWLDYRLRSVEEISAVLGVPVLGVVPAMPEGQRIVLPEGHKVWGRLRSFTAGLFGTLRSRVSSVLPYRKAKSENEPLLARATAYRALRMKELTGEIKPGEKTITAPVPVASENKLTIQKLAAASRAKKVLIEPRSAVAEAYRTIRTAVFFGAAKDEAKVILVTSPAPGDGKSTVVSNLAIAMAQAGQKTLIIDCDFRKPMQHKIFDLDSDRGISSVLAGRDTVERAIQPGPVSGLDILPCGPEVPNPSEILNSEAFARRLKMLSECYDRVIVDSPPVGMVADSQILAALCDVVLVVLKADKSTRRQSRQARDILTSVGGHILGAVVNCVPLKRSRYGYYSEYSRYGGYRYYSHYGYYGETEKKTG